MSPGWRVAACALIGLAGLVGLECIAQEVRFRVEVDRGQLHAQGAVSSSQHAEFLAATAATDVNDSYPRPAVTEFRSDEPVPAGWRLLTELSLRIAKELADGHVAVVITAAESSIAIEGATGRTDKVRGLIRRMQSLRLDNMTLTERLVPIDATATGFADRCERRLAALSAAGGLSFAQGRTTLTSGARPVIDRFTSLFAECPGLRATISGHTNALGDADTNVAVSLARAEAVRDALVRRGVSADRLRAIGLGSQRPLAEGDDAVARRANRRVEFAVWRP